MVKWVRTGYSVIYRSVKMPSPEPLPNIHIHTYPYLAP